MITPAHIPACVLTSTDGHTTIITDTDSEWDEPTRTDIPVPSEQKFTSEDNWCDGLTLFALLLLFVSFTAMIATDVGEKAQARYNRAHTDTSCALTSR